jgi:hypothetical protein
MIQPSPPSTTTWTISSGRVPSAQAAPRPRRKDSTPARRTATLRNVAVQPPYRGLGLERRLIQRIEDGAASLGVAGIILGGPRRAERGSL